MAKAGQKNIPWKIVSASLVIVTMIVLIYGVAQSSRAGALNEKTNKLEDELAGKEKELETLRQQVDDLSIIVKGLEDTVDSLRKKVNSTESNLTEKDQELANTEDQLKDVQSKVSTKQEEIKFLKQELEKLREVKKDEDETFTGEVIDELSLGSDVGPIILDDGDINKLSDGEIELADENYDIEEKINLSGDVSVGINGFSEFSEEFGNAPYLVFGEDEAIIYMYVFEDIPYSDINEDEPLEITFLGREWKIIDGESDEITLRTGTKVTGHVSEVLEMDGHQISIEFVSENGDSVILSVDGESGVIDEGDTKEINGLEITADLVIATHSDTYEDDFVRLIIGDDVEKTYDSGDDFFEDDDRWEFRIVENSGNYQGFQVVYNVKGDELDDEYPPLPLGEKVGLPYNYAYVELFELTPSNYEEYSLYFDDVDSDGDLTYDTNMAILESTHDEGILIDNKELNKLYIERNSSNNWDLYYENDDGDLTLASGSTFLLENDEYETVVSYETSGSYDMVISEPLGKDIKLDIRPLAEKLGDTEEESEKGEIKYDGYEIGSKEHDIALESGLVVNTPESNGDNDEFELLVPSEIVEATVVIG